MYLHALYMHLHSPSCICLHPHTSAYIRIHLRTFARSTNSDSFQYFVHAFPYITNKSNARSTNLSKFLYFAHKKVQQPNIIRAAVRHDRSIAVGEYASQPLKAGSAAQPKGCSARFVPRRATPTADFSFFITNFFFLNYVFLFFKLRREPSTYLCIKNNEILSHVPVRER